jgi:hypothetical protein
MLLASAAYDPVGAVSKATTSLLAMTALDTTNLRLTFTAPTSGIVMVRLRGLTHGAAAVYPRILLGVLDGATLRGRSSPHGSHANPIATGMEAQEANYLVTGLTPGNSYTWDASYGVEIVQSSSNLKYGGPNDAAGNDAFGAFAFEVWSVPNLLGGIFYDPTSAATKAATSLLAMTALDTTNLRLTITTPPSGKVLWRVRAQSHGSTTVGQLLLGVMEAAAVVARAAPVMAMPQTLLATSCVALEASGIMSLSGGSHTLDAAYAVQTVMGAGGVKYGGPNNTTTDDAFGGLAFELWRV